MLFSSVHISSQLSKFNSLYVFWFVLIIIQVSMQLREPNESKGKYMNIGIRDIYDNFRRTSEQIQNSVDLISDRALHY